MVRRSYVRENKKEKFTGPRANNMTTCYVSRTQPGGSALGNATWKYGAKSGRADYFLRVRGAQSRESDLDSSARIRALEHVFSDVHRSGHQHRWTWWANPECGSASAHGESIFSHSVSLDIRYRSSRNGETAAHGIIRYAASSLFSSER